MGHSRAPGSRRSQRTHIPRTRAGRPLPIGRAEEAADFIRRLAHARSRAAPAALRSAATQASIARWSALLTTCCTNPPCSQSHHARPGNPHRPRWRNHTPEHLARTLPLHPPAPGIPPPSTTLRAPPGLLTHRHPKSKWPGTWSAAEPPPSDLHAPRRGEKKNRNNQSEIL